MAHVWKKHPKCPTVFKCEKCNWGKEEYRVHGKIKTVYYNEKTVTQFEPECLTENQ